MSELSESEFFFFFFAIVLSHFNHVLHMLGFELKMWWRITGVKRPAETNYQQKDEDDSKKRRFITKWTVGDNGKVREMLTYDSSTEQMYCGDGCVYGSEKEVE